MIKIFGILVILAVGYCEPPSPQYGAPISSYGTPNYNTDYEHDHSAPKSYEFGYQVKDDYSGNNYNRQESSDGNQVNGEYRVQLPDGRLQIVTYYADWQSGFHADVRYEGTAHYPENHGGYAPPAAQYGVPSQYTAPGYGGGAPATSSVSIKDYSGPDSPYNAGSGHSDYDGYHHGGYDSYTDAANYGNRPRPGNAYGAP